MSVHIKLHTGEKGSTRTPLGPIIQSPPSQTCAQIFLAGVDGGLSGGSSMRRPGSEDPHRHQRNFYYLFWRISPLFWWYLDRLWVRSTKINESEQLIFDLLVCHLSLTWLCLIHSCLHMHMVDIWQISSWTFGVGFMDVKANPVSVNHVILYIDTTILWSMF